MPRSTLETADELFVAAKDVATATRHAKTLPHVDISSLDTQWLQVNSNYL